MKTIKDIPRTTKDITELPKKTYFFPDHQITVEANSVEEANELLKELINKE